MIYTSYFAKIKEINEEGGLPISIARWSPRGYYGAKYSGLAPTQKILDDFKANQDEEKYEKEFKEKILDRLSIKQVMLELESTIDWYYSWVFGKQKYNDIYLICYEKPGNFCHRHLVAEWMNKNGVLVKEKEWKKI